MSEEQAKALEVVSLEDEKFFELDEDQTTALQSQLATALEAAGRPAARTWLLGRVDSERARWSDREGPVRELLPRSRLGLGHRRRGPHPRPATRSRRRFGTQILGHACRSQAVRAFQMHHVAVQV